MSGPSGIGPIRGDALAALRGGRVQGEEARLRAATRLLEGTFYQELFKAMRQTVPQGGVVDGGAGEAMFTELMDQHVSDAAALRATRGIGQALYDRFVGALEGPDPHPAPAAGPGEE